MKSLHYIFSCLLTIALSFLSRNIASSSDSSTVYPGRRFVTEVQVLVSSPNQKATCQNAQIDDETKQSRAKDGTMALEYEARSTENLEDIVYHIDYHGVTTHPTPTPKHPKP